AFDQRERIALHQHAVGEGAAVALVGVADDIFLIGRRARHRPPFDSGREARPPAAAQTRGDDLLENLLRAEENRLLQALEAAMTAVILDRQRRDDPAAGE